MVEKIAGILNNGKNRADLSWSYYFSKIFDGLKRKKKYFLQMLFESCSLIQQTLLLTPLEKKLVKFGRTIIQNFFFSQFSTLYILQNLWA